jgi:hypothetical protein
MRRLYQRNEGADGKGRKPDRFRAVGVALILLAFAMHIPTIAYYRWNFDPRLSCDRLPGWGEWISCIHGSSHLHVTMTEIAIGCWILAAVGWLSARSVPFTISVIVPITVTGLLAWAMILVWRESVTSYMPFGESTLSQRIIFTINVSLLVVYTVFPVAGAWLLGVIARRTRQYPNIDTGP